MEEKWKEYHARHPDLFTEDIPGYKLHFYQKLILRAFRLIHQRKNYIEIDDNFKIVFSRHGITYLYKENSEWKIYN